MEEYLQNERAAQEREAAQQAAQVWSQQMLEADEDESDSESDSDEESGDDSADEPPAVLDTKGKGKEKVEKVEWSIKKREDIAKRSNKHA